MVVNIIPKVFLFFAGPTPFHGGPACLMNNVWWGVALHPTRGRCGFVPFWVGGFFVSTLPLAVSVSLRGGAGISQAGLEALRLLMKNEL